MTNTRQNMSWMAQVRDVRRTTQESTVVIIKTNDPKRYEQYMQYWEARMVSARGQGKGHRRVFSFEPFRGVREATLNDKGSLILNAVTIQVANDPFANEDAGGDAALGGNIGVVMKALDTFVYPEWEGEEGKPGAAMVIRNLSKKDDTLIDAIQFYASEAEAYNRHGIVVVFSADPSSIFDSETIERCGVVEPSISTLDERLGIIEDVVAGSPFADDIEMNGKLKAFAEVTRGLTLHQTESVTLASLAHYQDLDLDAVTALKGDIIKKAGNLLPIDVGHTLDAVGGYEMLKESMTSAFLDVLRGKRELAKKKGMKLPRGLLLWGPPGTGKTWLCKALAKSLQLPFFKMGDFRDSLVGGTEKNIANIIKVLEANAPCVLFWDEVDAFAQRGGQEHDTERRAYATVLDWLGDDKRQTIVMGTTNRPSIMPPEFLRAGRWDIKVPMMLPDVEARTEILRIHTSVVNTVPMEDDVDLAKVAQAAEWFSGGELVLLIAKANKLSLDEDREPIAMRDFTAALSSFKMNEKVKRAETKKYLDLADSHEYCTDSDLVQKLRSEAAVSKGGRAKGLGKGKKNTHAAFLGDDE